jgi:hypothetical protein
MVRGFDRFSAPFLSRNATVRLTSNCGGGKSSAAEKFSGPPRTKSSSSDHAFLIFFTSKISRSIIFLLYLTFRGEICVP